jgi:SAM-dependent methyltransferase
LPIRNILPHRLSALLWGDRERWGLTPNYQDPCWQQWQSTYTEFYQANQRKGIGTRVNDAGYAVMSTIDLSGKCVLEIGAGDIRHIKYWRGKPAEYLLADVSPEMMTFAQKRLDEHGVTYRCLPVVRNQPLALDDASVDVIVSFYSLEHLYPLRPYLDEFRRLLKPRGCLIGAIPAEGGLAWGGGVYSPRVAGSRATPPSIPTRSSAGNTPTSPITSWPNSIRCSSAKPWTIGRCPGCLRSMSI